MKTKRVNALLSGLLILTFILSACSISAAQPTSTPPPTDTPQPTATITLTPTNTPKPSPTPRPTATPNLAATQQMEELNTRLKTYLDKGYISTSEGRLYQLDDYQLELAQINYFSPLAGIGYDNKVKNFVFRADFAWENDGKNPETSGCGVIFRHQDNGDFYSAYLDTERVVVGGYAASAGNFVRRFGVSSGKGTVQFGNPASANFTLIANEEMMYVLVDDQFVGSYTLYADKLLDPGYVAYFLKSGTNSGFGTRCEITNSTLWVQE
jgi:hypothetical protein